jgi:hypothetical protein
VDLVDIPVAACGERPRIFNGVKPTEYRERTHDSSSPPVPHRRHRPGARPCPLLPSLRRMVAAALYVYGGTVDGTGPVYAPLQAAQAGLSNIWDKMATAVGPLLENLFTRLGSAVCSASLPAGHGQEARLEAVDDPPELGPCRGVVGLLEDRPDDGRDHAPRRAGDEVAGVPGEVDATALPGSTQSCSPTALTRPRWSSEMTRRTPEEARPRRV